MAVRVRDRRGGGGGGNNDPNFWLAAGAGGTVTKGAGAGLHPPRQRHAWDSPLSATGGAGPGGKFGMESEAGRCGVGGWRHLRFSGRAGSAGRGSRAEGPGGLAVSARSRWQSGSGGGGGGDTSPLPPPGHGQSHVGKRQRSPGSRRGREGRAGRAPGAGRRPAAPPARRSAGRGGCALPAPFPRGAVSREGRGPGRDGGGVGNQHAGNKGAAEPPAAVRARGAPRAERTPATRGAAPAGAPPPQPHGSHMEAARRAHWRRLPEGRGLASWSANARRRGPPCDVTRCRAGRRAGAERSGGGGGAVRDRRGGPSPGDRGGGGWAARGLRVPLFPRSPAAGVTRRRRREPRSPLRRWRFAVVFPGSLVILPFSLSCDVLYFLLLFKFLFFLFCRVSFLPSSISPFSPPPRSACAALAFSV